MIAVVNIELYRYEIHSLLKAFYPQETVKVFVGEPDAGRYPDPAFLRVQFEENRIKMQITGEGGPVSDEKGAGETVSLTRSVEAPEGAVFNVKGPECKTAAKHLLYETLSEYTGTVLPWGELIGIRPTKIAMTRLREGDTPDEAAAYMEREHYVSTEKAVLAAEIAQREREILSGIHYENGFSLYVGIPFCPTTCLYCSFTSYPLTSWKNRVDEYLDALEREMEASAPLMQGKILDTLYIGGGTPTTLEPAQSRRLIGMIGQYFDLGRLQEFTVEAGRPDSITAEKLSVLKECGVERISVNPQTMLDRTLKLIGRQHSAQQTIDAFTLAREAGFDNINMDIILGLPGETPADVQYTIDVIGSLKPDDLTVHSLAIKRASRLHKWIEKNGFTSINNTDESMQIAAKGAADMGMKPYYLYRQKNMSGNFENVGYAREGKAGIYNILIMEEKQSILALGAGSISKCVFPGGRIERCDDAKEVEIYMSNIDEMIERKRKLFGS
jgi:oxygen-independent coproporphyrinogen-3 oxidase